MPKEEAKKSWLIGRARVGLIAGHKSRRETRISEVKSSEKKFGPKELCAACIALGERKKPAFTRIHAHACMQRARAGMRPLFLSVLEFPRRPAGPRKTRLPPPAGPAVPYSSSMPPALPSLASVVVARAPAARVRKVQRPKFREPSPLRRVLCMPLLHLSSTREPEGALTRRAAVRRLRGRNFNR